MGEGEASLLGTRCRESGDESCRVLAVVREASLRHRVRVTIPNARIA